MKNVVAGVIHANCSCCAEPQTLIHHVQLGPTRMVCLATAKTYLDRGDGLYQPDGQMLDAGEPDLLSDRPARTADKTRISLERATFA